MYLDEAAQSKNKNRPTFRSWSRAWFWLQGLFWPPASRVWLVPAGQVLVLVQGVLSRSWSRASFTSWSSTEKQTELLFPFRNSVDLTELLFATHYCLPRASCLMVSIQN